MLYQAPNTLGSLFQKNLSGVIWTPLILFLLACISISSTLQAAENDTSTVEVSTSESDNKPKVLIPSLPGQKPRADRFVDGKVLVKRVELKGDSLFPQYGVTQQYLSQAINQAFKNLDPWMSISDMHTIANAVTIAYHAKGLTFNQIFIVPNEIRNNTLTLNVLPGRISEINLKNNKLFSEKQIKAPFLDLLGKVVYEPDIQKAMKKANLIQGLKVFGFFSVGKYPGQTRLNIHVVSESRNAYAVRVDNYGVENTGAFRVMGFYSQNNITGRGDTLDAKAIMTNETGNLLGSVSYQRPIDETSLWGVAWLSNQYEVVGDFKGLGLTGLLSTLSAFFNINLLKQENAIADLNHSFSIKNSRASSDEFKDVFEDTSNYITYRPTLRAIAITPDGKQRQSLSTGATVGHIIETDDSTLNQTIFALHFDYNNDFRWQPGNPEEWVTKLGLSVDYAPDVLPPSERMVLTGAYAVRSYKPALFSGDSVYSLKYDQTFMAFKPYNGVRLSPYYFVDYAYGEQNKSSGDSASFLGTGFGMMFQYGKNLTANVSFGIPITESLSQAIEEEVDDYIIFGYMSLAF